jgi:hypothetical protein
MEIIEYTNKTGLIKEWPVLDIQELKAFHEEIKLNKTLVLGWVNPGRIDPKAYDQYIESLNKVPNSNSIEQIVTENPLPTQKPYTTDENE